MPAPGADSRWGWQGFLPLERNPSSVDPVGGVVAAANHDFYAEGDVSMADRLPGDFASPWRVRRIRKVLDARSDWTVHENLELQRDVVSDRAIALIRLLREDLAEHGGAAAEKLLAWDGRMAERAVAPHVFSRLVVELGAAIGADELAMGGDASAGLSTEQLLRLLAGGMDDGWWDDVATGDKESRRDIVRRVLEDLDRFDPAETWGQVHQVAFEHPLTGIPVAGRLFARSWNRGPFPMSGDNVTVNATYWSRRRPFEVAAMPAMRLVVDVGEWDRSVVVMPVGQSGRPWSSHFADQIMTWGRGGAYPLPFSDAAVEAVTEARLVIKPAN